MCRSAIVPALAAILAASGLASSAAAHEYRVGGILVDHPVIRVVSPQSRTGAGFMTISNNGPQADTLVAVTTAIAARTELHETVMSGGMMQMRPLVGGVALTAGAKVAFQPGGRHVMFIGLSAPVAVGQKVKAQLVFARAGKVDVEFVAEGMANPGHDH